MRLGVFGGTFDPVHVGHLILAEQCREQARLDQVLFIPAARPPHKTADEITPFAQRVEMLALAVAGHEAFLIDPLEKDRVGPSFTVDTLALLRGQQPDAELFLIIGSDSLRDFPTWHRPERIAELATLLVVERPDYPAPAGPGKIPARIVYVTAPLIDISSTDIRRRVNEGRSIRYLAPRAVEMYIRDKGMYCRVPRGDAPRP